MPRKKKEIIPDDPFNYSGLISFLCVAALIYFSITKTGVVGLFINNLFSYLFGNYYLFILISLFICAFINVFLKQKLKFNLWFYTGLIVFNVALMLLSVVLHFGKLDAFPITLVKEALFYIKNIFSKNAINSGGLFGTLLIYILMAAFDYSGTITILVLLFLISAILMIPLGVFKTVIKSAKDTSINAFNGVKDKVNDLNEKRQLHLEFNKAQEKQKQALENRQRLQEEQRKLDLERDIHNIFNEDFSIPDLKNNEKDIEKIKNTSEFSKTYFLDDDKGNNKLNQNLIVEETYFLYHFKDKQVISIRIQLI